MRWAGALRVAVLMLLAGALLWGDAREAADAAPLLLRAQGGDPDRARDAALAGALAPSLVVRRSAVPPTGAELETLAALAAGAPLLAALPEGGDLWLEPPRYAQTERAAALRFGVQVRAGDSVRVRLHDGAGVVDSTIVAASAAGRAEGAFRVLPARDGWQEWRVEAAGVERRAGAWVRRAAPPGVLVAAGPPTWESRFVLRALEESGALTGAVMPLGRGLHAGTAGQVLPADSAALTAYDVVVVLPGAAVTAAAVRALERFVAGGGGVLGVGRDDVWRAFGLSARAGQDGVADAGAISWQLPTELAPLPAAELQTPVLPLGAGAPGAYVAAAAGGAPLLALRPFGLGRAAGLGVLESWRWRMEGGMVAEHRDFWRGLVDWLAGEGSGGVRLHLAEHGGPVGAAVHVELHGGPVDGAPTVRIERPGGASERVPARPVRAGEAAWRVAFVPDVAGVYAIGVDDQEPAAAYRALAGAATAAAEDGAARLTLLAYASGGAVVPADSVGAWLDAREAAFGPARGGGVLRWLLLAALLGAAAAEWAVRRLSGVP